MATDTKRNSAINLSLSKQVFCESKGPADYNNTHADINPFALL